jgi:flavin reductase (DIM6/NTAB) family NADH-FMN oxidoreductase RutF
VECPVNIECRLFESVDCGSHLLVIGEVVEIHADRACVVDGKPDTMASNPIVYAQTAYWQVGDQVAKAFSAGKELKNR